MVGVVPGDSGLIGGGSLDQPAIAQVGSYVGEEFIKPYPKETPLMGRGVACSNAIVAEDGRREKAPLTIRPLHPHLEPQ